MTKPQPDARNITADLCHWIENLTLADIPTDVQDRVKYLILDTLGCGLVGAHLPWSKTAAESIFDFENTGSCHVLGWSEYVSPPTAALLNSTFIQGFELDDYHLKAPIHSGSIIVPVLLALVQHVTQNGREYSLVDGASFLLAAIVGYELGPRVGLALHGVNVLKNGWHSGAVFGPSAAAAAACKLLGLPADAIEDALGIACTQAGGLMSAQYGSMAKRMQHGFAARNGLTAALMASKGYTGIKQVFEQPYGGFLKQFSHGNGQTPAFEAEKITNNLGREWEINNIVVKPYASMAATHVAIDCIRSLQEAYPIELDPANVQLISNVIIDMSEVALKKGGWRAEQPITTTGAQMNTSYAVGLQLLDCKVTVAQFLDNDQLNRENLWTLINKISCRHNPDYDAGIWMHRVRITIDEQVIEHTLEKPRSQTIPVSNIEVAKKWRETTEHVLNTEERATLEAAVTSLETLADINSFVSSLFKVGHIERPKNKPSKL